MPLPFRLDYVIDRVISDSSERQRTLRKIAGVKLSKSMAQAAWARVLEHKWYLSERLGRDVGLRVAAVDFFENIEPPTPRKPFSLWNWNEALPPRLPMMLRLGERINQ